MCVFIQITTQSDPAIYSFCSTYFMYPPTWGFLLVNILLAKKCACTQLQLLSSLRPLLAITLLPRHQLLYNPLPEEKDGDEDAGNVGQACPSNTWVKLVARRLAQQIETGIRQTGSTVANSPCNLLQSVYAVIPFILIVRLVDVPAGVTQEEGNT